MSWKQPIRAPDPALLFLLNLILISPVLAWDEEDGFGRNREREVGEAFLNESRARQTREMEDFAGAVYRGGGNFVIVDGDTAVGSGGAIIRAGDTFLTPRGTYVKSGDSYLRPDGGAVVKAGPSFVSWDGTMVRAGNVYVGSVGTSVVAGNTVFRNFRNKPAWSSR